MSLFLLRFFFIYIALWYGLRFYYKFGANYLIKNKFLFIKIAPTKINNIFFFSNIPVKK